MACTSCRKRKIRCLTSEQPPTNPCAYCKRKRFHCEYVVVNPGRSSTSHNGHLGGATTSDVGSASWKPPITLASFSATPPSPALSPPGNRRSDTSAHLSSTLPNTSPVPSSRHLTSSSSSSRSSPSDSTFPPLPPRRKKARHRRTAQPTHSPESSHRPHSAAPPNQLYDLQTLHALEYLSSRPNHSQPCIQPPSQSAEHFNFAEDVQMPDLDLNFTVTDMYAWALEVDAFHFGDDLTQSDCSEMAPVPTSHDSSTWRGSTSEG